MTRRSLQEIQHAEILSAAMRGIRRARRMRVAEIARAMDMPVRSYEHFEAGRGRISYDRLTRFAEAVNCDAAGLMASVALLSPEFALRCADNKLMTILMITLRDLNEELGNDITYLETGKIIGGFTRVCKEFVQSVRARDTFAETWLAERVPVGSGRDSPARLLPSKADSR